ncbi:hypothetical protein [Phytoactinopolyspora mesophila]|uniref:DUF4254 domain-containing protein n=1 Tax=Phytoactinopolyspora mesophila TaxID=2650750 RepID=A0A7K3M606_9ACTN|nr:hypothetical protein [Phytoactinopolyspora mesophila]NDL58650.1 hypothetical protein [Phytoactinopolyspora mesophila]
MATTITTELETSVRSLATALSAWNGGDYDPDNPHQRQAATDSIETIDAMIQALHQARSELVTQARRYDDASNARTDELLARLRAERECREMVTADDHA